MGTELSFLPGYRVLVAVLCNVIMRHSFSTALVAALGFTGLVSAPSAMAACGKASYYGTSEDGYAWQRTASGERMNPGELATAHPSLPFGTRIAIRNMSNGREVTVRVNDRGPFVGGRILDLSPRAFSVIAPLRSGTADVCYSRL